MAGPSWAWPTATFLSEGLRSRGPNKREMHVRCESEMSPCSVEDGIVLEMPVAVVEVMCVTRTLYIPNA